MKTPTILLWAILLLTAYGLSAQQSAPRKNYVAVQVGLWPTDVPIYTNGEITDGFRFYGPVFGLTYGRVLNRFIALEGNIFLALTGRRALPDYSPVDHENTRYGFMAGAIVTPFGNWFRYIKLGIMPGYIREDAREGWQSWQNSTPIVIHRTTSNNNFGINFPMRVYALDSPRYFLCAEANIQTVFEPGGMYRRRTVNYTVNFGYKF